MNTANEPVSYSKAVEELLTAFSWNPWFTGEYWPMNEERMAMILRDAKAYAAGGTAFEVGCGLGHVAYLLSRCGYDVTATDAWCPPERDAIFERARVRFFPSNLNDLDLFPTLAANSFDVITLGEVIEHILNHPFGLVKRLAELLRPGGLMIVDTPNCCTLWNGWRMITNKYNLWGTHDFIHEPKIKDGEVISIGEIHYHEYSPAELRGLLESAGLTVLRTHFLPCGIYGSQSWAKRTAKRLLWPLLHTRLLGAGQYMLATKR
jgi:SAM-dependent methyltransferase